MYPVPISIPAPVPQPKPKYLNDVKIILPAQFESRKKVYFLDLRPPDDLLQTSTQLWRLGYLVFAKFGCGLPIVLHDLARFAALVWLALT